MTFNTPPKFAGAFFNWLSRIGCGSLALLAFAMPLPAVDMLYVSLDDFTIVTYDTSSGVGSTIAASVATFANTQDPYGLAFDSTGNLYAANYFNNTISKFNSSGGYVSNINTNLKYPSGLAFDTSGNLYAANSGFDTISKFDPTGTYVSNVTTNLNYPTGLAFDTSGNLYAGGIYNGINKFDPSGTYVSNISQVATMGLAFDSSGSLYAANVNDSTISKFNASGGFVTNISWNLNRPYGLAFDSSGNLYAANRGDKTISKFDPVGVFLTSWSTGTASPGFLAFRPVSVPEPSTYALAAIATSVMAYLARRRKARTA
jgi:sugar lactone lactonase YvrE